MGAVECLAACRFTKGAETSDCRSFRIFFMDFDLYNLYRLVS